MNMKRILVLVMTFAMLLSTFAPTIGVFAEELHDHAHELEDDGVIDYVSLGDSMSNGIGFEEENGYDKTDNPDSNNDGRNGYLEVASGAYPAQFAAWLAGYAGTIVGGQTKYEGSKGTVNLTQLATSGARVEDVYYMLTHGTANQFEPDYWTVNELLMNSDRWGDPNNKDDAKFNNEIATVFQESVKKADVVSIATGNGNFGVFLTGRIMNLVGLGDPTEDYEAYDYYTIEKALELCEADEDLEAIVLNVFNSTVASFEDLGLPMDISRMANLAAYTTASYLVYTMKTIELIVEMNPDVTIVLLPLINNGLDFSFNVTNGGVESSYNLGEFLDQLYRPINDYLAIYPAISQAKGEFKDATFLYAELPTDENGDTVQVQTFAQAFGELYVPVEAGMTNETYPANRLFCHNRFIGDILDFVFGTLGLSYVPFNEYDVRAYELALKNFTLNEDFFVAMAQPLITALQAQNWEILRDYYSGVLSWKKANELAQKHYNAAIVTYTNAANQGADAETCVAACVAEYVPEKLKSMSMYLGFVEAILGSMKNAGQPETAPNVDFDSIELDPSADSIMGSVLGGLTDGLMDKVTDKVTELATPLVMNGVDASAASLLVMPEAIKIVLLENGTLATLLGLYGKLKLAWGLSAHPSTTGHDTLTESLINSYNEEGIPATVVLEKMHDLYMYAAEMGVIGELPELAVVEEIYEYLDTNDYITDEQTLDIILCAYMSIEDKELSDADRQNLAKYTYETLVRNPLLSATDRVEIVGNVYFILKANNYLNEYTALEVVEEIYEALDAEGLISDEQSYAIVDYVYETVIDGEVSGTDLLNVVKFIYETLVKGQPVVAVYARRAAAEGNEASAKTIRIVLGVLAENYLSEENKASLETLVTGNEALINDALLVEIVDNIIAEVENSETNDQAVVLENVANTAIQTVLNDENTSAETKTAIVGEIKNVADNNEILDNETSEVVNEAAALANKIYENLYAKGLMNAEQKEEIIDTLIDKVVLHLLAGNEFTTDNLVELVVDMGDIIFGREDMTVEQKVDILVVVYKTLDEEGYITEENAKFIAGIVLEYYDEAYFEAYKYLDENGYIDVAVIGIEKAIEAIYVAIEEVAGGLLGTTDELTVELVKELYATIETLKELIEVLANDSAKDVNGLVATVLELEDDLYTHLNNIYAILRQGSIDINQIWLAPAFYEALRIINEEVIPAVKAAVEAFVEVAVEYVQEKVEYYYGVAYDYIVEVLVKIQLYAQEKLHNAIAPILNAYERLVEYYEEIYGTVEEAVRVANAVFAKLFELNEKLHGKLTEAIEEVVELFVTMYEIYGNVEDALVALNTALMNIAERVDEVIGEVIAAYNALVKTLVEIYGKVEDVIDTANGIYNNVIETLEKVNGDIENTIKNAINLYNAIIKTLANTYDNIENIIIVAGQIFGYVADFLNETLNPEELANILRGLVEIIIEAYGETKDAYYVASQIYAYFAELNLDAYKDIINGALQGNYELTDDSMYVALGNALYAKELAEMLNLKDKFFQFGLEEDYAEKVAGADLITIKLDNGEAYEFALKQLTSFIDPTVEAEELEWDKYLDAEGQKALESVLAAVKADLIANGVASKLLAETNGVGLTEEFVAEMIAYVIENTLYAYAEFVGRLTTVLENVRTIAPEATVVLTGIENPLAGFEFSFAEFDFDLGKYAVAVDGVVGALNAQLFAAALVNENTIFVNSNEAADIYDALNVYCDHVYDNCEDTDCNRCGATRKAPGHNYGDWEILKQPTIEEQGRKQRVCKDCGHIEFALIDPIVEPQPTHKCESKCPVCGKCMDKACTSDVCKDKCPGHDPIDDGNNGRTLVIVIVCVVVAAGAGAAVYFFVIKKKRA